jgi:hypothetical protein
VIGVPACQLSTLTVLGSVGLLNLHASHHQSVCTRPARRHSKLLRQMLGTLFPLLPYKPDTTRNNRAAKGAEACCGNQGACGLARHDTEASGVLCKALQQQALFEQPATARMRVAWASNAGRLHCKSCGRRLHVAWGLFGTV